MCSTLYGCLTLLTIISLTSWVGNFTIIVAQLRRSRTTSTDYLVLALAFVDFLTGFVLVPTKAVIFLPIDWDSATTDVLCRIERYSLYVSGMCMTTLLSRPLHQSLQAADAMHHGDAGQVLQHWRRCSLRRRLCTVHVRRIAAQRLRLYASWQHGDAFYRDAFHRTVDNFIHKYFDRLLAGRQENLPTHESKTYVKIEFTRYFPEVLFRRKRHIFENA
ncbi:hypothetical protein DPMN_007329 [Dreissena polymorpha]|uniref:G-protein coupled receptors family 1 profile domain-containing protein n=1 Tax=Dreissena polymorpha TaxID=45954 RepID=A0A9D4MX66_DREPO|nr:hypothetical protein DPMN_007329 [Dreissena polymorpha]